MENPGKVSIRRIRNFRREIRKIEEEIRALEQDLETGGPTNDYWPESRLYTPEEEEKGKSPLRGHEIDMDFVVPWQMK